MTASADWLDNNMFLSGLRRNAGAGPIQKLGALLELFRPHRMVGASLSQDELLLGQLLFRRAAKHG
jgi:hypothetical protein